MGILRNVARRIYRESISLVGSRKRYRFFLQRTFESLDRRTLAILCSTNVLPAFIRPIQIRAPFGHSVLVVAPHQDDEIIGCGGAMLLQKKSGRDLSVVFTQDGGDEHSADGRSRRDQVALRESEAEEVAEALGIPPPLFLRHVHLIGDECDSAAVGLREEIERTKADVIFAPFFLDHNIHHQRTNYALAEALARITTRPRVMGYEVWGLTVPNVILNIDEVQHEKARLLGLYRSQLSGKDYVRGTTGLNMYHSMQFQAGECSYAERFFELPAAEYVKVVRAVRSATLTQGSSEPAVF